MLGFIIGVVVGIPLGFLITGWYMFLKMKDTLSKPVDLDGIMKNAVDMFKNKEK